MLPGQGGQPGPLAGTGGGPELPATSLQPGGSRGSRGPDASSFEVLIPGGEE